MTGANGLVTVAGKGAYRDVIEYRPGLSGGVTAVNRVELENYIRGVVPNESPASWPIEALKAQAVAARSYALGTGTGNAVFDHYDTVASQVYGGYSSENARTNRAVARTRGEVLRHERRGDRRLLPLDLGRAHREQRERLGRHAARRTSAACGTRGTATRPTTAGSSRYSPRSLGGAMGVGRLRSVNVHERGVSGRIVRATFRGSRGRNRVDGWNGLRGRLGLRDIPSTFKRITAQRLDRPRRRRGPGLARARTGRLRIGLARPQGRARSWSSAAPAAKLAARRARAGSAAPGSTGSPSRPPASTGSSPAGDAGPAVRVR